MAWSVYLFQTITGQLGPRIEPSQLDWEIEINGTESITMTLPKSEIPRFSSKTPFLDPWWGGVALLWNNRPIVAGPIVSRPSEDFHTVRVNAKGIRSLLARRQAVQDMQNWSRLSDKDYRSTWSTDGPETKGDVPLPEKSKFREKTYASLARMAVEISLKKLGGELPIVFPVPITTFRDPVNHPDGTKFKEHEKPHYRRWAGYQGMTVNVDAVLTELSELDNGPDILFVPKLNGSRIYWEMWTGKNDTFPEFVGDHEPIWDTTSHNGTISNLTLQLSGSKQTNRAFAIGSGSGGGQPMAMSQDTSKIVAGYPLLESFETFAQFTNSGSTTIKSKATELLRADDKPRHQLTGTVRVEGPPEVGTFWPGHYGQLITKGWYGLSDGTVRAKILSVSGDLTQDMDIGFQETEVL